MPDLKRIQKLDEIDQHVWELLKKGVPLILGWDGDLDIFLTADISGPEADDDPPFDQEEWLEYMVSDGLPGQRTTAESYYSFKDAQAGFEDACAEARRS